MSTLNDLSLIGNIVIDEVYAINGWPTQGTSNVFNSRRKSIGGIGNLVEALKDSDLKITVNANVGHDDDAESIRKFLIIRGVDVRLLPSSLPTSKAIILSDLTGKERTSFVNWGCGLESIPTPRIRSRWTHISYLDVSPLTDIELIRSHADILSADLCLSNPSAEVEKSISNSIPFFDYIFISSSELMGHIGEDAPLAGMKFLEKYGAKTVIWHTREQTVISKKSGVEIVDGRHQIVQNVDVLGAGDAYCANFILYLLKNDSNDRRAAEWAHEQATKFIIRTRI